MKIGVTLRNMGTQSSAETMSGGAQAAEARDFESVWITDHIAIPPDDAEGSGGRYTDTLTTLAWLGGKTDRIKLGSGVLILPYRPILPTAKQVATIHELTGHRLILGVGIGWMDPEFRALGVDRHQRGKDSDAVLAFLNECFENEIVSLNGQEFLFKPRPPKPEILIGGRAPHALQRALKFNAGWLPMAVSPEKVAGDIQRFRTLAAQKGNGEQGNGEQGNGEQGNGDSPVTVMGGLDLSNRENARKTLDDYRALDVDRLVCGIRYDTLEEYVAQLDLLANVVNSG